MIIHSAWRRSVAMRVISSFLIFAFLLSDSTFAGSETHLSESAGVLEPAQSLEDAKSTSANEAKPVISADNFLEDYPLSLATVEPETDLEKAEKAVRDWFSNRFPAGTTVSVKEVKDPSGAVLYWRGIVDWNSSTISGELENFWLRVNKLAESLFRVAAVLERDYQNHTLVKWGFGYDAQGVRTLDTRRQYDAQDRLLRLGKSFYESGRITVSKTWEYGLDGKLLQDREERYHENGRLKSESTTRYVNGIRRVRYIYEYDTQGERLRNITKFYYEDGSLRSWNEYQYEAGRLSKRYYSEHVPTGERTLHLQETYHTNQSIASFDEYTYSLAGRLLQRRYERYDDTLDFDVFHGNILESFAIEYPEVILTSRFQYQVKYWVDGMEYEETFDLQEGANNIQRAVTGFGGIPVTVEWKLILDTTAPEGALTINEDAAYTASYSAILNLTVSDAVSGISDMRFSADGGNTWTDWEAFSATRDITLSEGDGNKEVRCQLRDQAGNIGNFTDTIILDTLPPIVTGITGPTLTNTSEAAFTWQGSDSASPIAGYSWRLLQLDGTFTDWTEQPQGQITLLQEISNEGTYEIQFQVQDAVGHVSDPAIHSFTIDRTAPSVVLTSPALTNQQAYALTYTVTDNVDAERVVTEQITLLQGSNVINRTVRDAAGNSRMLTWTVAFLPVASVLSGYEASVVPLEWVTTPTATGITGDDRGKSFTLPFSFRFFGQEYTQIQVSSNGFVQFGACSNCIDYTPESIPNSNSPNAIAAPLWRDLDPGAGGIITYLSSPAQFVVSWDNVPNYGSSSLQRFQLILKSDGDIIFQYEKVTSGGTTVVGLEDPTGTRGTIYTLLPRSGLAVRFTSLFAAGFVSINQDETYTSSREVTLSLAASSPYADLEAMRFSTDGGGTWSEWENYATVKNLELPEGDGNKEVRVQVKDLLGFKSEIFSDSIILDTAGPAGSVSINNNTTYTNSNLVTLYLAVLDNGSGLDQMRFSLDSGLSWTDWEAFAFRKSLSLPEGDGTKGIQVEVSDRVGHISTFTDTITLDTTRLLQEQNLLTFEDVRKVIILGPLADREGDPLTYSYVPSTNLTNNGRFILLENQLTYIPNRGFTGSGAITIQATDGFETEEVTLNLEVRAAQPSIPNDPSFSLQYGLNLTRAVRAWNLSRGSGVDVAIIDTGIAMAHPDLAGNIFSNPGEIAGNTIDDDGNGFIDDVRGWNFVNNNNNPINDGEHGTHVAGIVAAKADNGVGGAGMAPEAKLIPLRVISDAGDALDTAFTNVARAIHYAVGIGAKVINMSLGWWTNQISSAVVELVRQAINAARAAGVVVVAAAGNENTDAGLVTPAAMEGVITVAATDSSDQRASFSNYGSKVEVAAPGVNVYSTVPSTSYDSLSGTSMASPFVTGLAALILSQDSEATDVDVLRRLTYSSVDLGAAGFDPYYGFGRIDAFKALSYDYYDDGSIKTQWLEEPDEYGYTRLDFDTVGRLLSGAAEAAISGLSGLGASLAAGTSSFPSFIPNLSVPSLLLASISEKPDQNEKPPASLSSPPHFPWDWKPFETLERNESSLLKTGELKKKRRKMRV